MRTRPRNIGKPVSMFEYLFNQVAKLINIDYDRDGVPDFRDCKPFNPYLHKFHKQRSLTPGKITQSKFIGGYGDKQLREIKKEKKLLKQIKNQAKLIDSDNDGLPDYIDCDPFDPTKQDIEFKSPPYSYSFKRGNQFLNVIAEAEKLPRNAILIRPYDISNSQKIYDFLKEEWVKGTFRSPMLSHGSCQHFINTGFLRKYFNELLNHASINCIDNIDDTGLQIGDIILTRHGIRTIGQPFLITKE